MRSRRQLQTEQPLRRSSWRGVSWRRLLGYIRPYSLQFAIATLALLVSSSLGLVYPWAVGQFTDTIISASELASLNQVVLALLLIFLFQALAGVVQSYLLTFIGERVVADLRKQLYQHLQSLSLGFYNQQRTGELTSRVTSDTTLLQASVTTNLTSFLQFCVQFLGAFVLMLLISWQLTLLALLVVPLIVLAGGFFGNWLRRLSVEVQDRLADATAVLEESIAGVRVVQSFAREPYEIQRFGSAIEQTFQSSMRRVRVQSLFGPLVGLIGFGGLAVVLWVGGQLVLSGELSTGNLIAILLYAGSIAGALVSFTNLFSQLQQAVGATTRVFELLDLQPEIKDRPGAGPLPLVQGAVRFEQVSFSYERAESAASTVETDTHKLLAPAPVAVLHDLTLEVQPGEVLALVGPSGAGKSTLVNLIARFYDVSAGRILIDGSDLREVQVRSLREQIGIVPQETLLFSGSVRDNILYGRLDADEAALVAAAQAAHAHEFILELPAGYDTRVGERGVKLSGGQRQRIAIARAILKNPRILILDEATSSLDSESEYLVQEALERLMRGRTSFVIAHRLSTVRRADRIAVLSQGRLIELGTHEQLMALEGLYHRLYSLQYRRGRATVEEWFE